MAVHVLEYLHAIAQLEKPGFLKIHIRHPWRFNSFLSSARKLESLFYRTFFGRSILDLSSNWLLCSNETPIVTTSTWGYTDGRTLSPWNNGALANDMWRDPYKVGMEIVRGHKDWSIELKGRFPSFPEYYNLPYHFGAYRQDTFVGLFYQSGKSSHPFRQTVLLSQRGG